MEAFFLGLMSYLFFALVGGLLGLAALMPRMRALAREERGWRIGLAAFLGLVAFVFSFVLWSLPDFAAPTLLPNLLRGLIAGAACAGTSWLLTRGAKGAADAEKKRHKKARRPEEEI